MPSWDGSREFWEIVTDMQKEIDDLTSQVEEDFRETRAGMMLVVVALFGLMTILLIILFILMATN